MIGDQFDSPLKLAIIAILIIVLFGARKLPEAARSLGKSMRILKTEVQGLHEDEPAPGINAESNPSAVRKSRGGGSVVLHHAALRPVSAQSTKSTAEG